MTQNVDSETARYIAMTNATARLDREAEAELIRRFRQEGDREARDRLVRAHLREVVFFALKYRRYGIPIGDLISEGNIGLMRAVEKFDPERGTRFSTYAAYWIRANVVSFILKSRSLVGDGTGVLKTRLFFKLRRERARAENLYGAGPEAEKAISARLGIGPKRLRRMLDRLDSVEVSLHQERFHEAGGTMLDELAASDDQHGSYEQRDLSQKVRSRLGDALAALDERERFIVQSRFLADESEELSLAEIGRIFGVSRERVRQLETRAKGKLRQELQAVA